jgi:hypothetical protein
MAKRLTDTDIAAIEARHAAATNGYHEDRWEAGVGRRVILITQDIPALLAEVRALREENEALRARAERAERYGRMDPGTRSIAMQLDAETEWRAQKIAKEADHG